jgi:hypothetical protein
MWNARLSKQMRLDDGRTLRTLADARALILGLPEADQQRPKWQQLAGLLLSASKSMNPDLLVIATDRIEHALTHPPYANVQITDVEKPAAPSVQRRAASKKRNA